MNPVSFPRDVIFLLDDARNDSSTSANFSEVNRKSNPQFPDLKLSKYVNELKYRKYEHKEQ